MKKSIDEDISKKIKNLGETRAKIVYLLSDGWMVQKFSSTLRNQVDPSPELREDKPSLRSEK